MRQVALERISVTADLGVGAEGFLVIDTTVQNSACGGLRVSDDLTLAEVTALAREMTLKFSFIGRRAGGAKSGVRVAPGTSVAEKRRLLREFGHRLGPLLRKGIYSPGTDINCGPADLAEVYAGAGIDGGESTDTALFTAIGVRDALLACGDTLGPGRLRVAVEGFGAVAAWLAERLPPDRYAITAISTVDGAVLNYSGFDPAELAAKKSQLGDAMVSQLAGTRGERSSIFSADVDIFVPSARTWSISMERARSLRAHVVAPIANAPYAEGTIAVLESRGIACLPGFVVNSGGIYLSSLFDSGVSQADVESLSGKEFRAVVRALLQARSAYGISPVALAEAVALERLARRSAAGTLESPYVRVARSIIQRRLPLRISGASALARARSNLRELAEQVGATAAAIAPPRRGASAGTLPVSPGR